MRAEDDQGVARKLDCYAVTMNFGRQIGLQLAYRKFEGNDEVTYLMEPIKFRRIDPNESADAPTIMMDIQSAQSIMDNLWRCGLRPSEGSGSAGSLAATERHLEDMRLIVMNNLKITPPALKRL